VAGFRAPPKSRTAVWDSCTSEPLWGTDAEADLCLVQFGLGMGRDGGDHLVAELAPDRRTDLRDLLHGADSAVKPLLIEKFGADPGAYPPAVVPIDIGNAEIRYIQELVDAYCERAQAAFADHQAVFDDEEYGPDLRRQRDRFFEAEAFQKFYRDNTSSPVIAGFRKDIHFGVVDSWNATAPDSLARVETVMKQAGTITPAGPLAKYAHVPVKQGMCHHFVNDGEMSWKRKI
jgi:hypothetical protein